MFSRAIVATLIHSLDNDCILKRSVGFGDPATRYLRGPPYPLPTMLRIHLMQQWYSLSDPAMEDALIEVPTMRRFAGIDMLSDRIPDETTILAFRHLLEKHNLGEQIFETVKAHLRERGMAMKQGTIIDATLIAAPSSTKNKAGERDPEMHQTKKGQQWYFGMKIHAGVDKDSGPGPPKSLPT